MVRGRTGEGMTCISSSRIIVSEAMGGVIRTTVLEGIRIMGCIIIPVPVVFASGMEAVSRFLSVGISFIRLLDTWTFAIIRLSLADLFPLAAAFFFACPDLIDPVLGILDSVTGEINAAIDIHILKEDGFILFRKSPLDPFELFLGKGLIDLPLLLFSLFIESSDGASEDIEPGNLIVFSVIKELRVDLRE